VANSFQNFESAESVLLNYSRKDRMKSYRISLLDGRVFQGGFSVVDATLINSGAT